MMTDAVIIVNVMLCCKMCSLCVSSVLESDKMESGLASPR